MKTFAEPPPGYGYGVSEGRFKYHLIKIEELNVISICGAYLRRGSIITETRGAEHDVCSVCLKMRKRKGF